MDQDRAHYSMLIEWEPEGKVYVVTVPELPGCMAHGDTYEEAVQQAQEVIDLWLETMEELDWPIPPPRYYDLGEAEVELPEPVGASAT
jgi:predicted RNase H-like HicB family nuclease